MAIDMSQFYQVFFDESVEHLASMESLLLAMNLDSPDSEDLNAIFRAAHSIKGSSGTFGFTDMTEVTHVMETLLDMVRKGRARLSAELVDGCLAAGDVLRNLLAAHRGEGAPDCSAATGICQRLEELARAMATQGTDTSDAETLAASGSVQGLQLSFIPDAGARARPGLIDNLLAELGALGRIVRCEPGEDTRPWQVLVETEVAATDLRALVEFIADPASVQIVDTQIPAEPPTGEEQGYGFFEGLAPVAGRFDDDPDGAFGFFTELPLYGAEPASDKPAACAPAVPAAGGADDAADGGYGFFEPLVAPAPAKADVLPLPAAAEPPVAQVAAIRDDASPGPATARAAGDGGSIRVGVEKVDQLINLVGELVITQAMLTQAASGVDAALHERLLNGLAQLERNTRDLQESVMSIRMLPISVVFSRFPRVVHDISQKLGKRVELKTRGEHTELDKGLVERLTDPLTHLVRNSLDHGIESPERRQQLGKSAVGTITLRAYHQRGNVVIEVGDDGAGLDRGRILDKAREGGLAVHDAMSDPEVWQLIFEAGFSTAEQVTEVSGRGVGMDVVKRNIAALGGRIEIESMFGIGTRMTIRLPLTLAILDGMSVTVGEETYILPLGCVVESLQPTRAMMRSISGAERLIQVRGEYLPVINLRELFGLGDAPGGWCEGIMVIIEADGVTAALLVDALVGQHQVVIKSLEANYRRVDGVSGATIMGDGRVALILDAGALVGLGRHSLPAAA